MIKEFLMSGLIIAVHVFYSSLFIILNIDRDNVLKGTQHYPNFTKISDRFTIYLYGSKLALRVFENTA